MPPRAATAAEILELLRSSPLKLVELIGHGFVQLSLATKPGQQAVLRVGLRPAQAMGLPPNIIVETPRGDLLIKLEAHEEEHYEPKRVGSRPS
jgi:hypothetical protein